MQKDDYYPFGGSFNAYTDPGTAQQNYLYNGVRFNQTSQLYETAFRTYDPYLGRFNHIDPLTAMVPGLSPYHFGFNNPVRYSDPMGLMGQDEGIWGTGNTHASKNPLGGFTGPGSGKHWSDGWDRSDWNAWSGSDSYRAEKAYAEGSGGYGYGGSFKDGNGNQVSVVNGQLQVWYPMGGDLAFQVSYEKGGRVFLDQYYHGAWGDPIGGSVQTASILSGDYTPKDVINYGMAGAGFVLGGTEAHLRSMRSVYDARGTKTAQKFIGNVIDPSISKLSRNTKGLGIAGVILNGTITGVNWYDGHDVTASQVADLAFGVIVIAAGGLAIMSAPVALVVFGTYGLLDSAGVFDGIKSYMGGDTVVLQGYMPGN